MLKLLIENTNVDSGTIPIRFCVSEELLNWLSERNIQDPQVLIITAPVELFPIRDEERYVVPLKQVLFYLPFFYTGEMRIFGMVLGTDSPAAISGYLETRHGRFTRRCLNAVHDDFCQFDQGVEPDLHLRTASQQVHIPESCLAKPPPTWLEAWAMYASSGKIQDECDLRKRVLLGLLLNPIYFVLVMSFRLYWAFVHLGILSRGGIRLRAIYRPFTYDIRDIKEEFTGSYLVPKWHSPLKYMFLPLMPLAWVAFLVGNALFTEHSFSEMLRMLPIAISLSLMSAFFILSVFKGIELLDGFLDERASRPRKIPSKYWYQDQQEASLLTCSTGPTTTTVSSLPMRRRSIKLRVAATKSQICRPYIN